MTLCSVAAAVPPFVYCGTTTRGGDAPLVNDAPHRAARRFCEHWSPYKAQERAAIVQISKILIQI